MKKRILLLSFTIVMILGLIPFFTISSLADNVKFPAASEERNDDGSYHINNLSDWQAFANDVMQGKSFAGQTVYLENDISISEPVGRWAGSEAAKKAFRGTFDGKGHTVTINCSGTQSDVGVFSATDGGAVIRDLTVAGSVAGNYSAGGVVGNATNTTIENCTNQATVHANSDYAGGIAGWSGNSTKIINCTNHGAVSSDGNDAGGIAGIITNNAVIADCLNTKSVKGKKNVGGIAGYVSASTSVFSCMNDGEITSIFGYVGGIAGAVDGGTVASSANNGKVSYTDGSSGSMSAGGILGAGSNGTVTHSVNKGEVFGTFYAGGIIGIVNNGFSVVSCVNCGVVRNPSASKNIGIGVGGIAASSTNNQTGYIRMCANYGNVYGYQCVSGIAGVNKGALKSCISVCTANGNKQVGVISGIASFSDSDGVFGNPLDQFHTIKSLNDALSSSDKQDGNYWGYDADGLIVPILTKGLGSKRFPYTVTTPEELLLLAQTVNGRCNNYHNYENRVYVRLDADIYDKDSILAPIGGNIRSSDGATISIFKGVFDGNGHTVYLKMNVTDNDYAGLFGRTENAYICNLRVAGSVTGTGSGSTGGIAGYAANTYFVNCQNDANVTGKSGVGGIAGGFTGVAETYVGDDGEKYLINCINRGTVTATEDVAGGIVGDARDSLGFHPAYFERCLNLGNVRITGERGNSLDATYVDNTRYRINNEIFAKSQTVYYCKDLCEATSGNTALELSDLMEGKFPEGFLSDVSDNAKKACGDRELYSLAVCGESIGFKEFDLENKEYADVYYPGTEPTFENDGHKSYWYSYFDDAYYEDETCKTEIAKDRLNAWLTVGRGFLEKLDAEKTYTIDDKLFTNREEAEEYLHDHCNDGISFISLGGDITTTLPIRLKGDYKNNKVILNGHTWTYQGKDDSSVFVANEYGTRLWIYGYGDEKRMESEKGKTIIDIIDDTSLAMPTIQVDPNYRCRLLVCSDYTEFKTDYVRILNTTSKTNGGAIYSSSPIEMNLHYTVFDHALAWENGGAVYFTNKADYSRSSYITLDNTVFRDCSAIKSGGAIYADIPMQLKGVDSAGFISCHADTESGGALAIKGYDNQIESVVKNLFFEKCYCGQMYNIDFLKSNSNGKIRGGGAISMLYNPCKVYDCKFSSCLSDGCGGSIYAVGAENSGVYDSTFINSAAVNYGQDIYIKNFYTWEIKWELKNILINSNEQSADLVANLPENNKSRGENVRIVAEYIMQPYRINLTTENITRGGSTFYSSILSDGSFIAVICGGVLVIAALVVLTVWTKRKKRRALKAKQ